METAFLKRIMVRDLEALRRELRAYDREPDIWACPAGIENSTGTLVLHLTGNLQHFVGTQLGYSGYVRDREAEFADREVPIGELEARIDQTVEAVAHALDSVGAARLVEEYPLEVAGVRVSTGLFLMHLAAHLAYHLGQVDYHRRVVTARAEGVSAQSITQLAGE
jgi:uncharacterized damage-inducible protein DinB